MQIQDWFNDLRTDADELANNAREAVDRRDEQQTEKQRRYAKACRDLPAAAAAHAPFRNRLVDAKEVVTEAKSNVWNAERDLRNSGALGRRSEARQTDWGESTCVLGKSRTPVASCPRTT